MCVGIFPFSFWILSLVCVGTLFGRETRTSTSFERLAWASRSKWFDLIPTGLHNLGRLRVIVFLGFDSYWAAELIIANSSSLHLWARLWACSEILQLHASQTPQMKMSRTIGL